MKDQAIFNASAVQGNAELREQLVANAKFISELQHTVRLLQETRSRQVHEYARKAALELFNVGILAKPEAPTPVVEMLLRAEQIICEAFSVHLKPKDECREAYLKAFPPGSTTSGAGEGHRWGQSEEQIRWDSWREAWKLLKGEK